MRKRFESWKGPALAGLLAGAVAGAGAQPPSGYELTRVDFDGNAEVLTVLPGSVFAPRISPDGTRIAYETGENAGGRPSARLWVAELANLDAPRSLPIVAGPMNWAPMWTADGERLVFLVSGDAPDRLFVRRADGTDEARHLLDARSAEVQIPGTDQLTFLTLVGNGDYGLSLLDIDSGEVAPLIDLPGSAQHSSNVAPDGRWIAYASNETGRYEVWVEPLPRTGTRHQVTRDGGGHPMWARDGSALYYDRGHRMYRVDVRDAGPPSFGTEVALPIQGFEQGEYRRQFDLLPDGRGFLVMIAR